MADLVTQVHKDFAPGIEAAQSSVRRLLPLFESKCREVVTRNGRATKKNTAWIASALGGRGGPAVDGRVGWGGWRTEGSR